MSRTKDAVISLQNYERSKGRILSQKESDAFWHGYSEGFGNGERGKQVNITLSEKAVSELEEMQKQARLGSIGEVIKSSVAINKFLQDEMARGNELILHNKKTGIEKTVVLMK